MSLLQSNFYISDNIQIPCWILTVRKNGHEQRWYKAKEIAKYLRYDDTRFAILSNVPNQWRTTWSVIRSVFKEDEIESPPNWQSASQFITEEGIYLLIFHSTKRLAKLIQNYICENILSDKFAIVKRTSGEPFKNTDATAEVTCCAQAEVTIHEQREQMNGLEEQLQTANDQINNLTEQLQIANNTAANEARAQAELTINEQLGPMSELKEQLQIVNNIVNNQMSELKEQLQIVNNQMSGLRERLQTANNNADNEAREQAERSINQQRGEMNGMAEQLQNANNTTTEETALRFLAEETMNLQLAEINSLLQNKIIIPFKYSKTFEYIALIVCLDL